MITEQVAWPGGLLIEIVILPLIPVESGQWLQVDLGTFFEGKSCQWTGRSSSHPTAAYDLLYRRYVHYIRRYLVKNTTVVELHATPLVNCISNSNALCDSRELCYIQGVPPICWQLRSKFWKLKNHICLKVSPVLKSSNKNLSDHILKPSKIKLKVFLNWR